MISLEQVLLLETRVAKAIDHVKKITAENEALVSEREVLQKKLEANQKRIDELEVHVMRFKEDQGRIEDGIIAALDRLSQFEEAFENSLKETAKKPVKKQENAQTDAQQTAAQQTSGIHFEIHEENKKPSSEGELDIF
jgi:predicted nuclease with TOPRIM domain